MKTRSRLNALGVFTLALILLVGQAQSSRAQGPVPQAILGTGFTYQGQLNKSNAPVNDTCSFTFSLWDAATGNGQVGASQTINSVKVEKGLFTVLLNAGGQFGANAFIGQARWLQTTVKCTGDASPVTLSRQQLTAAPYAQFASAPWVTSGNNLYYNNGNIGVGTTAPTSKVEIAAQDGLAISGYQPFLTLRDTNAASKRSVVQGVDGSIVLIPNSFIGGGAAMTVNDSGNVGIGIPNPSARLSVVSGAPEPSAFTLPTGVKIGTAAGTIPLAILHNAADTTTPSLATFETASGDVGSMGAKPNAFVIGAALNHALAFNVDGSKLALDIDTDGDVLISNNQQYRGFARLFVTNSQIGHDIISVLNSAGNFTFEAKDDGSVWIGYFPQSNSTAHLCRSSGYVTLCGSAAEYVPSVDSRSGFPETADLVSIAPTIANPYGDTHAPFAVQKSSTACDPNLLGFIVDPERGADGEKKNDHYLPLAIYGYFPAKVTLESGAIHRGDALTSSSKPGYAMKATDACKIIGYALEDAQQEGTIQVFAQHGETAAAEVATLRTQVEDLKKQNGALAARLDAIERAQAPVQTGLLPNSALLWGALAVVGAVIARRWRS